MEKVRLGYLGVGGRAQGLINCYQMHPQLEFVAFADIAENRAAEVAANYNATYGKDAKAYTCYEDMMKEAKMDALLIAMDPDKQVDYAVDAMHRGIHVMTEVPAAYTIDQCWALVNAVKKTGCKYQLGEQTRYWNFIKEWRNMAAAGEFGKIYYAEGEYLHYEPYWDALRHKKTNHSKWPTTLEELNDPEYEFSWRYYTFQEPIFYMPHELSPLLSITGGRIEKVSCIGTRRGSYAEPHFPYTDLQTALMYNSNDAIFSLRAGFSAPYGPKNDIGAHWYQIKGSKATAETCRSTLDTMKLYRAGGEWETVNWGTEDPTQPEHVRQSAHGGADFFPIMHFIDAIINDKTPPMDVYKAVECAAPAIKAAESARKGGILLEVPDFRV
ncbi:MAG: Gfo/Idh/MocA family oxidoreductase [Clostridia bacterium]|nr:Gfo/Idh/MocA family oxidoreductase [Clostridia bacterium]